MGEKRSERDSIHIGNITNAQGIAVGSQASAQVSGNLSLSGGTVDVGQLRAALERLYDVLGEMNAQRVQARSAQTAVGNSIATVNQKVSDSGQIVESVKTIGETIKEANVVVEQGTSLWHSIQEVAVLVGPVVGGARAVASWFGMPF